MKLRVHVASVACLLLCAALVAYKLVVLGYTFSPGVSEDRWSVQVSVWATGRGERARVHLALPAGAVLASMYDERFGSPGMKLAIGARTRRATFTSDAQHAQGSIGVTYRFSARMAHGERGPGVEPPKVDAADTAPSDLVPAGDDGVRAKAAELAHGAGDETARTRAFYDFVVDEVPAASSHGTPEDTDALAALARQGGGALARLRLFVALARASGLPARVVHEIPLAEGRRQPHVRAEVFADGAWVPVDPVRERFGVEAEEGFPFARADGDFLRTEGLDGARMEIDVTRESVNEIEQLERRTRQGASVLDRFSFFSLSPRSQLVFRVLLLVPLGALIVALFRNLVGVPTIGTFTPILIALALRETQPLAGLGMLGIVLVVGFMGRRALDRMRLLLVPRLSLLLTFVIFIMGGVALAESAAGWEEGLGVALLPMVIMTMTIERLSVLLAEEGVRHTLRALAGTMLVTAAGYAAIQSDVLQRVVVTFPELNLAVVAALVEVGAYTGYRASELLRFRALARREPAPKVAS